MAERRFTLRENTTVSACPRCGNNTVFTGRAQQVAEDCCEVWVECVCGFDPTAENTGDRLEDVWGGVDNDTLLNALGCWNDALRSNAKLSGLGTTDQQ